jgi:hypothetical protein
VGTTAGSNTQVATTDANPAAIQALLAQLLLANQNIANPTAVNPVVQQIMRTAALQRPTLYSKMAQAGLYNSTTAVQLQNELDNNAQAAASKVILDYTTQQQGIATTAATNLGNLTRTQTSTGTTNNQEAANTSNASNGQENATRNTASPLSNLGNISKDNLLLGGAGLLGSVLWNKYSDKILQSTPGAIGAAASAIGIPDSLLESLGLLDLPTPPEFMSAVDAFISNNPGVSMSEAIAGAQQLADQAASAGAATSLAPATEAAATPNATTTDLTTLGNGQPPQYIFFSDSPPVLDATQPLAYGATDLMGGVLPDAASTGSLAGDFSSFLDGLGSAAAPLGIVGAMLPGVLANDPDQAALGSVGAGIGTMIFPGIGTALGALLGNLAGKFIGPGPQNAWSSTRPSIENGRLSFNADSTLSQLVNPNSLLDNYWTQADALNRAADMYGFQVNGDAGSYQIGYNTPGQTPDPTKFIDLITPNASGRNLLSSLSFSGNSALEGRSFNSLDELFRALSSSGVTPTGTAQDRQDPRAALQASLAAAGNAPPDINSMNAAQLAAFLGITSG